MSRLVSLLLLTLFLVGCGLAPQPARPVINQTADTAKLSQRTLVVGTSELTVEVANTDEARSQGLSDRPSLAANEGMLFVFDQSGKYGFWMNRMNFPLDFIWLYQSKVVEVTANIPNPSPAIPKPVTVTPAQAVDAVIEVNAGWVAEHEIDVGVGVKGLTGW